MFSTLKRYEGSRLAIVGLAVAAILFFAVNMLANATFRGVQVDLTDNKLFTVSQGTRNVLAGIDEPIHLRLYFSQSLADLAPQYGAYYNRVRELLQRYNDISGGKLIIEQLDPVPFSPAEDRAVGDGLQGISTGDSGEVAYFGLAGSNSTDGHETIPFFNLQRESFLEYDLTRFVLALSRPKRPVLGILQGIADPPDGGGIGGNQVFQQLRDFFTVQTLDANTAAIPDNVDVIFVIAPDYLKPETLHAIDAFAYAGKPVLMGIDPNLESVEPDEHAQPSKQSQEDLTALLGAWGLVDDQNKVAGDLDLARRVNAGGFGSQQVVSYVAWLSLPSSSLDKDDPIFANIERINLASAGVLKPEEGRTTTITPLLQTGPQSMEVDVDKVKYPPNFDALLRDFKPSGHPLMLAARVSGEARPAFASTVKAESEKSEAKDTAPAGDALKADATKEEAPKAGATTGTAPQGDATATVAPASETSKVTLKPINAIVFTDLDMLFDRFWLTTSQFFGEQVVVPNAGNGDFVINALENLLGSGTLSGLRGRGVSYRPFTLVDSYQREAEQEYRAKEQELQAQLRTLQSELDNVRRSKPGESDALLSADEKATIERYRGEILGVRRQLRDVQLALRSNIEDLVRTVKLINIGAVPLVLCVVVIVVSLVRRVRRKRAMSTRGHVS